MVEAGYIKPDEAVQAKAEAITVRRRDDQDIVRGADYFAGHTVKARATGALAMAKFATEVAKNYPITVALHTDHCPKDKLDGFVRPLLAASTERVKNGGLPYFQSHMWDGSAVPLEENLQIAQELLAKAKAENKLIFMDFTGSDWCIWCQRLDQETGTLQVAPALDVAQSQGEDRLADF